MTARKSGHDGAPPKNDFYAGMMRCYQALCKRLARWARSHEKWMTSAGLPASTATDSRTAQVHAERMVRRFGLR